MLCFLLGCSDGAECFASASPLGVSVSVSGRWTGVDSVREQKKLEARKMLENAAREAPQHPVHALLGGGMNARPTA